MDIDSSIIERVNKLVHEVARRCIPSSASRLCPRMTTSESITRSEDELLSTSRADTVDGGLVVLKDQLGVLQMMREEGSQMTVIP